MTDKRKFRLYDDFENINKIKPDYYTKYRVKRGLRNADGSGVIAGVTNICNVHGYVLNEGEKEPAEGELTIRGYNIQHMVDAVEREDRFGFEEIVYLLLTSKLPTKSELEDFMQIVDENRALPPDFFGDMILKMPSKNIMNKLARAVLTLYSYDDTPDSTSVEHEIDTAISIIAKLPVIMVLSYYVKISAFCGGSMIMHPLIPGQSTAETILSILRPDRKFTREEAKLLDVILMLHSEHGGGNNSTFSCRVLSSSGTDPYSAYAAAIGSLKGPKHGGANLKVTGMHNYIKEMLSDWTDEGKLRDILADILRGNGYDNSGLIYGMGHAIYTNSDPRAQILKANARKMAVGTDFEKELNLLDAIERIAPEVIAEVKGSEKVICANFDMYSGFIYRMLGIPSDLFTPLFAVGRMAGWSAHRFEELVSGRRIIRPAYKSVVKKKEYVDIERR